ncbi:MULTISPECIES: DUF2062 domain-containing protein [Paenibacillus]|uniref:DUF2062 domain-containing protein n=1 Tax=Paenibacillus TaxID=44249 RepID=UPI00038F2AEA|nr:MULTISPECIES: DUF2062 domain-containing protein [Paenibacillus]CDN45287.1 Putative uncharacterized protein [Paenibacillus sp. P22]
MAGNIAKSKPRPMSARIGRWIRYKFIQLLRAPGGPSFVAMGFSIGLFCEMFTLPTYGLAFFLIFPLIYMLRGSLAGALIGFVIGKVIYLPFAYLHNKVGGWVLPTHLVFDIPFVGAEVNRFLLLNFKLIVGGVIDGIWLGALLFFPVRALLRYYAARRKEKRRLRRVLPPTRTVSE